MMFAVGLLLALNPRAIESVRPSPLAATRRAARWRRWRVTDSWAAKNPVPRAVGRFATTMPTRGSTVAALPRAAPPVPPSL